MPPCRVDGGAVGPGDVLAVGLAGRVFEDEGGAGLGLVVEEGEGGDVRDPGVGLRGFVVVLSSQGLFGS